MTQDATVHVKGYLVVFGTLLVLTLLTVAVSYLTLPPAPAIVLGLAIATSKAALVALFFMHLKWERRLIHIVLAVTAVKFLLLLVFTLWTEADHVTGTLFTQPFEEVFR